MLGDETKARNITCQMSDFLKEWVIISWIICFIFISENTNNILFEPSCSCICVLLYILYRWFINSISIPTVMNCFMQRSSKAGRPTLRLFWWSTYHFSYSAGGFRLYSVEISYLLFWICIESFFFPRRDYITKNAHLFPEEVKTDCLSLLTTMTERSQHYFTSNMHKELKVKAKFCFFHFYVIKKKSPVFANALSDFSTLMQ